jgi:hypothetical protein
MLLKFNKITGKQLYIDFEANFLIALSGIALTGFVSYSYPVLYLSGFKPALVLVTEFEQNMPVTVRYKSIFR